MPDSPDTSAESSNAGAKQQPVLSAEWLRQPEAIEFARHLGAFAAALMSSISVYNAPRPPEGPGWDTQRGSLADTADGGVGRLAPQQYPPNGLPWEMGEDGKVPFDNNDYDHALRDYTSDEQRAANYQGDSTDPNPVERGIWQMDRLDGTGQTQQELRHKLAGPAQPTAPAEYFDANNGSESNGYMLNDQKNTKLKAKGGGALME